MDTTIIFNIDKKQKELLRSRAKEIGLGLGTYCRLVALKSISENKGDSD